MSEKATKGFLIHQEISKAWFQALLECGSACVHNGIVLRYWLFIEKYDISKFKKLRALRDLEDQGLIKVERHPGSNPRVMVVDPPSVRSN